MLGRAALPFTPGQPCGRAGPSFGDLSPLGCTLSALLHAGLAAVLATALPVAEDAQTRHEGTAWMASYRPPRFAYDDDVPDAPGTDAPGEEGAPGTHAVPRSAGHLAIQGIAHAHHPRLARREPWLLEEVGEPRETWYDGIGLTLGHAPGKGGAPLASWGKTLSEGRDLSSARAPIFGRSIRDAAGPEGLGLSGTGEGGGGRSRVIGLGAFERGRTLETAVAQLRMASPAMATRQALVSQGHVESGDTVPPDPVGHVVRDNHPRFRFCYAQALWHHPGLRGRVTTRLVLDSRGRVISAVPFGSEGLGPDVVNCVTRTFRSLSFPPRAGGRVTVDYPFVFSPADAGGS